MSGRPKRNALKARENCSLCGGRRTARLKTTGSWVPHGRTILVWVEPDPRYECADCGEVYYSGAQAENRTRAAQHEIDEAVRREYYMPKKRKAKRVKP